MAWNKWGLQEFIMRCFFAAYTSWQLGLRGILQHSHPYLSKNIPGSGAGVVIPGQEGDVCSNRAVIPSFLLPPCGVAPSAIEWQHCSTQHLSEGGKGDAGHLGEEEGPWKTKTEHNHTLFQAHTNRAYMCLLQGSRLDMPLFIKKGYTQMKKSMMHVGFKEKKGVWDEDLVVVIVAKAANLRKKKKCTCGILLFTCSPIVARSPYHRLEPYCNTLNSCSSATLKFLWLCFHFWL